MSVDDSKDSGLIPAGDLVATKERKIYTLILQVSSASVK